MPACLPLLLALSVVAPGAPEFELRRPPGLVGLVSVTLDLAQAARVGGAPLSLADARAGWRDAAGWHALPLQTDALPDQRARFTVEVPRAGVPVRLVFSGGASAASPAGLSVARVGNALTINGPTYRVTHDPAKLGGLPSRFEFLPAGKVFTGFGFNDRVYSKALGGFHLRYDRAPRVELLAAGPYRVVVRVSARYVTAAGVAPPSAPRAVYTFTYTAGSPRVDVLAECTQQGGEWDELHLLELHFTDTAWPGWLGPRGEAGRFKGGGESLQRPWGALVDGDNLLGLLCADHVIFHDGRGGYGTYLHGPWTDWRGDSTSLRASLVLSGTPGAAEVLASEARRAVAATDGWLLPAPLAAVVTAARAQAGPRRWWAQRIEQAAKAGQLTRAQTLADTLMSLPATADVTAALADATGWLLTASDQLGAAWSEGRLVSLCDFARDQEYLDSPQQLWSVQLRDAGKALRTVEQAASVVTERLPDGVKHVYRLADGPTLTLTARVVGPRLWLHLDTGDPGALSLWQVTFPRLRLGALADSPADDRLFLARGAGWELANPSQTGVQFGGLYPSGWSTMQYLALYHPRGGLYVGLEDPHASTKSLFARGPDGAGRVAYGCEWPVPDMGRPHNAWRQPGDATLELYDGGWYGAAQLYRRWASTSAPWWPARAQARQTPRDVRELAAWACTGATPYAPNHVVARTLAFAKFLDVPTAVHWYNWHAIPFDDQYPHYHPTKPRVAEGVAELQRGGVKVMPYINGRLWDSRLDDFKAEAHRWATLDEDGQPYIEHYGSKVPLAPMCPTTAFWQDKVRDIVLWLQRDVGVDGVYIDQVAAAAPRLCFCAEHGHPLGGGSWWTEGGYWPLLAKLRAAMGPGKFLTSECNGEPYMQYFDGYLTWHWQYQDQVPAFSAVYADQVILFGRAYRGGPSSALANRMKAAQSLVFGEQLGWCDTTVAKQPEAAFFKLCAQTRHRLREYLAGGRLLAPVRLTGDVASVTADWQWSGTWPVTIAALQTGAWQAPDGRVAVIFANCSAQPVRTTWRLTDAAAPVPLEVAAESVTVVELPHP